MLDTKFFLDKEFKQKFKNLYQIAEKIISNESINTADGILLYEKADLGFLGSLANFIKEKKHGKKVFFNKNYHIEPTNICIYNCKFCSYQRKINQDGAWELSQEEILQKVKIQRDKGITELHIVGGVHPQRDLYYYGELLQNIKKIAPKIHIKGFTAVELDYMIKKANLTLEEGLIKLKSYGLESIPGGGAEIFNAKIRSQICGEKSTAEQWLNIHEKAHLVGLPSNATMLYGHIETYQDRIEHLEKLRTLQNKTHGFNVFIPLKYKKANNSLNYIGEVNLVEDLKNYAISRIFLDNFPHIKAYWVMIGKQTTQLALSFGVDDIDGTIEESTKIYEMAGQKEQANMTEKELINLIKEGGQIPVERDTLYQEIKTYI